VDDFSKSKRVHLISFFLESFFSYNCSPAMAKRESGIVGKMLDKNIESSTLNEIQK